MLLEDREIMKADQITDPRRGRLSTVIISFDHSSDLLPSLSCCNYRQVLESAPSKLSTGIMIQGKQKWRQTELRWSQHLWMTVAGWMEKAGCFLYKE